MSAAACIDSIKAKGRGIVNNYNWKIKQNGQGNSGCSYWIQVEQQCKL